MQYFGQELSFWIASGVAAGIKIMLAEDAGKLKLWQRVMRGTFTGVAAMFSAWAFTPPALDWLKFDPSVYTIPFAVFFALVGEGAMKWIINAANDPLHSIAAALQAWRGKK